ncbi:serine hydrolase [Bradyrhizobium manausense]|uniref:serine hydrolase n=1 Tax=Bradyrhizobium TaxID=374 RepID=UPI001BA5D434|nr:MULTISPECIES: serine hydrolase [Bradyrhizobium]MBR0826946.1 serine hydrolase [Bradyrhizobium manausense]UVO32227.1 serine hydrolase [Bradyrhizobium arachidis]
MNTSSDLPDGSLASLIPDIDRLAADAMAVWKVPGAALAIVRDGKVVLARAYGQRDVEADLPITPRTQFVICSITKTFTATAIALLHNEGLLDWSKPVRDYLPEFRLSDAVATERVTIRDLLSHQSGLPRHDWVHVPGDLAPAEMLPLMRHLELSKDIRAVWQYNNLCYNALGLLIARVSGKSFEAFVRERLTNRLGMSVSFSLDDLEAGSEPARPYMMNVDTRLPALRIPIRTTAAGAINTSVADLANWMRLHLGKGEFEGERLLPAALVEQLHTPLAHTGKSEFPEFDHGHYALGFQSNTYRGERLMWHGGGWTGWSSLMTLVPGAGIGVAVLTNRSPSEVPTILSWYIIDRLRGREPADWLSRFRKMRDDFIAHIPADKEVREKARHKDTRPAHALSAYAADYAHPAYGVIEIRERDGALHWSWRGMGAPLSHWHFETFMTPEIDQFHPDNLPITFQTDREGNIAHLSVPLEPTVKDIVFERRAAGDCLDPAFRARCVGQFRSGAITHRVTLDSEGRLILKPDYQPAYRLEPQQGRRFRVAELEGFAVEFRGEGESIGQIIFHQPNGTSIADRVVEQERR